MLDLLLRYAKDHGLITEPGFKPKRARWAIVFNTSGRLQGVNELGDPGARKNPGRQFNCCPDLTQPEMRAGGDGCRHFLLDSAQVVSLFGIERLENDDLEKAKAKHEYFVNLLREAREAVPELPEIADSLSDVNLIDEINAELAKSKAKPTDGVTIALANPLRFIVDSHAWHEWWRGFRRSLGASDEPSSPGTKRKANDTRMLCLATGELVEPAATHFKIEGLSDVGGLAMGDALISFKQDSFRSYGLEQSANAAMSEEAASTYRAALNQLLREHSRKLAGVKIVHWFAGEELVAPQDDPFEMLNDPSAPDGDGKQDPATEAVAQSRAGRLLDSIRAGQRPDLLRHRFYALSLSANSGRVVIRDWMEGQFEELAAKIAAWFGDLAIVHRGGSGLAPPPKFLAVVGAIVRELADAPAPLVAKLWRVGVRGEAIPDAVVAQALGRVKVDVVDPNSVPNHARYGLLKAYLKREGDQHMSAKLNEDHPDAAYQCGRLMAVLADIQQAALPDVKAGIVQRYYAAACSTPALVLGRLFRTANFHLDKIRGDRPGLAVWFEDRLASIAGRLDPATLPETLDLKEQTLFALGYYQQKASRKNNGKTEEAGTLSETM